MEIRRAQSSDYRGVLELQSQCLFGNLTPEERREGFLSAEFSLSQIEAMGSDLGIVVAHEEGRVVGYVCASRLDFMPRPPILDSMLACLEKTTFHGSTLTGSDVFVYGPVCIERGYRGRGLLRRMFERLKEETAGRFKLGVAFVAAENERSLRAHVKGLGMTRVGTFEHGGNGYHAVAFEV